MPELARDSFEQRRRKEQQAFLVVKFLRAFVAFQGITGEFGALAGPGSLAGCGLFDRVRELVESLLFDLKEKAHALYRTNAPAGGAPAQPGGRDTSQLIGGMKRGIETRSIDSYIGTGYHLMQILQESLYQIERYTPELEKERGEIEGILEIARVTDYTFSPEERSELERLQALNVISVKLAAESEALARGVMQRCIALFGGTTEVIRHFMVSARDNEILVLNLLQNRELVECVYGPGSAEAIFSELCSGNGFQGATGLERAVNYVRAVCGNVTALADTALPAGISAAGSPRGP